MLNKRATHTDRVYYKVVEPSLGSFRAIPLTSHCCVRYQPALVLPKSAPPSLSGGPGSHFGQATTEPMVATLPKIQVASRMTRSAVEIGKDQLLPVYQPHKDDASNIQRSATPNSFSSTTRVRHLPLPQVKRQELRSTSPRGMKNVSISGDRYLGTSRPQQPKPTVSRSYPQHEAPSTPRKEQVQRFEEEQDNLYHTRTLKRKSEIRSHRVDRMYYLCGSGLSVQDKYEVDEAELQRLRDIARDRNNSRANSGRSSSRSRRTFTDSSIIYDGSTSRSPLGSERHTPVTSQDGTVDLSVQGSGVSHGADEVKGQMGSDKGLDSGTVGNEVDAKNDKVCVDNGQLKNAENAENKTSNDDTLGGSGNQKTSPHRTGGEGDNKSNLDGHNDGGNEGSGDHGGEMNDSDGGNKDNAKVKSSNGNGTSQTGDGSQGGGEGGEERRGDGRSGDDKGEKDGEDGGGGGRRCGEGRSGDHRGEQDREDGGEKDGEGQENSGTHRDNSAAASDNDVSTLEEREGKDGVAANGHHINSHETDADGDRNGEKGQGKGRGGESGGDEDEGGNVEGNESSPVNNSDSLFIASIAPGWNLDKTPFAMKKSDVYLTDFGSDPRDRCNRDDPLEHPGITLGDQPSAGGHPPVTSHETEINRMEEKLKRLDNLTQEVDDVGHLAEAEDDLSDFITDSGGGTDAQSYDAGVFAKERSEEERVKAEQRRKERLHLKSAKKAAAIKAREEVEERKIASTLAKKKAGPPLKYKIAAIYNFISSRQKEIFKHKFRELDTDGNGVVSLKELTKKMHKWVPKDDIKKLLKVFDLNKDKTIDEREFVTVAALNDKLSGTEVPSEEAPLQLNLDKLSLHITAYREMFEAADQNQDGRLGMEEIMLIVSLSVGVEIGTDPDVVRHIHTTIDKDADGTIDFIEFLSYIPFFLKIHRDIIGRPVTIGEIEAARLAVRKAMGR